MSPIVAVFLEIVLVGLIVGRSYKKLKNNKFGVASKWWWQHFGLCLVVGPFVWLLNWFPGLTPARTAETYFSSLGVLGFTGMGLGLISGMVLFLIKPAPPQRPPRRPIGKRFEVERERILPKPNPALQLIWCDECEQWTPAHLAHQHSLS